MPLHFSRTEENNRTRIKEEEIESTTGIQPLVIEADDEEEEEDEDRDVASWRDSGIGTSLDEGDRDRRGVQRRRALFSGGNDRGPAL